VQEMVQRLFCLPQRPTPNDVADALAIAVTGVYRASNHRDRTASSPKAMARGSGK
jgi:Holliday junction resolvasome RuvABC endonuclease subunit